MPFPANGGAERLPNGPLRSGVERSELGDPLDSCSTRMHKAECTLVEQPIDIHFIFGTDKNHAVGDGGNSEPHGKSCLIALLVLI